VNTLARRLIDFHHIGLTVSDLETSIRFYRDLLGLTVVRRREASDDYVGQQTGYPGLHLSTASLRPTPDSCQSLEIAQYRNHAGAKGDPATNRPGNSHLCFEVFDLQRMYERLRSRGVRFRSEPVLITSGPNQGGVVIYVYDPDDYIIELFQRATV
jgi:catechol 2,3-dioxygenase-like lactoylglutathione lyase family enzyme